METLNFYYLLACLIWVSSVVVLFIRDIIYYRYKVDYKFYYAFKAALPDEETWAKTFFFTIFVMVTIGAYHFLINYIL